jgi:hypothetical protein
LVQLQIYLTFALAPLKEKKENKNWRGSTKKTGLSSVFLRNSNVAIDTSIIA